ncbi:trypco2 family protein [Dactylosporangium sp. McL0621]|uniref:trypco2 family protein n=1 Tax=Dactylosporangium sp. McL0621 TaxID=3415678 RepID=UPI003CE6A782
MRPSARGELTISDAIHSLRSQLRDAAAWAEGEELTFALDSVEVELQLTVSLARKGEAKVSLWTVVTTGGDINHTQGQTHTVRLKLTPRPGKNGGRLQLSDED